MQGSADLHRLREHELFGSDSDSDSDAAEAKPKVVPSPTASDASFDKILKQAAAGDPEQDSDEEEEEGSSEEEAQEEEEQEQEEEKEEEAAGEEDEAAGEEEEAGEEEDDEEESAYSLAALPSSHLTSVGQHVGKANSAGFYCASDSTIVAVQLPLKVSDESINYMVVAGRLMPKPESVRSRAVAADERAELVMGQSMVDAAGTRCRLVANVLVHATTAPARTELQQIFGMQPFLTWLAILDHPDHPALVLEPVHTLKNVAAATEAEIKRFRAPENASGERQESRGTQWLRLLLEGAQAGSVDGVVAPLLSMKEVGKAAKAAEKQAATAARAARMAAQEAARKEKAAKREARAAAEEARAAEAAEAAPPSEPKPQPKPQPQPQPQPMWPRHGLPVGAECYLRPAAGSRIHWNRKVTVAVAHTSGGYTVCEKSGREHVVGSERLQLLSLPALPVQGTSDGRRNDRCDDRRDDCGNDHRDDRGDDRRDHQRERTPVPKAKAKRNRDRSCDSVSDSSSSSSDDSPFSAHQRRRRLEEIEAAERARLRADVDRDERKREKRKRKRERRREKKRGRRS